MSKSVLNLRCVEDILTFSFLITNIIKRKAPLIYIYFRFSFFGVSLLKPTYCTCIILFEICFPSAKICTYTSHNVQHFLMAVKIKISGPGNVKESLIYVPAHTLPKTTRHRHASLNFIFVSETWSSFHSASQDLALVVPAAVRLSTPQLLLQILHSGTPTQANDYEVYN